MGLSALATASNAQTWYGQINAGAGFGGTSDLSAVIDDGGPPVSIGTDLDLATGYLVSAAIGHQVGAFRVEGEFVYADNDYDDLADEAQGIFIDDASISQASALVNVIYDFRNAGPWTPYVGAGIGYGVVRYDDQESDPDDAIDETDEGFTWQLKAGVSYAFSDSLSLDAGYRYLKAPEFEYSEEDLGETFDLNIETEVHVVTVGLRFAF